MLKTKKAIFAIELATEYVDKKKLNGFEIPSVPEMIAKIEEDVNLKIKLYSTSAITRLVYNQPNDTVYLLTNVVFNDDLDLNDEAVLKYILIQNNFKPEYELTIDEEVIKLTAMPTENIIYRIETSNVPKDFLMLKSLLVTDKEIAIYNDFMESKLVYKQLIDLCHKEKFPVHEDMINSIMLPIHRRDPNTGVIYLFDKVHQYLKQFQLAQNLVKGFDTESIEHQTGKLMLLRPDFAYEVWSLVTSCEKNSKEVKSSKLQKLAIKSFKKQPILESEEQFLEVIQQ
jgi:hypothetical protein